MYLHGSLTLVKVALFVWMMGVTILVPVHMLVCDKTQVIGRASSLLSINFVDLDDRVTVGLSFSTFCYLDGCFWEAFWHHSVHGEWQGL